MFDIGFWELTLIGVVALVVIGPDKLPGLARTAGMWIGKARHLIGNVKADIDRELKADELRRALDNNADIDELKSILNDTRKTLNETRDKLNEQVQPDYLVKADEPAATAEMSDQATPTIHPAMSDARPANVVPPETKQSTASAEPATLEPSTPEPTTDGDAVAHDKTRHP